MTETFSNDFSQERLSDELLTEDESQVFENNKEEHPSEELTTEQESVNNTFEAMYVLNQKVEETVDVLNIKAEEIITKAEETPGVDIVKFKEKIQVVLESAKKNAYKIARAGTMAVALLPQVTSCASDYNTLPALKMTSSEQIIEEGESLKGSKNNQLIAQKKQVEATENDNANVEKKEGLECDTYQECVTQLSDFARESGVEHAAIKLTFSDGTSTLQTDEVGEFGGRIEFDKSIEKEIVKVEMAHSHPVKSRSIMTLPFNYIQKEVDLNPPSSIDISTAVTAEYEYGNYEGVVVDGTGVWHYSINKDNEYIQRLNNVIEKTKELGRNFAKTLTSEELEEVKNSTNQNSELFMREKIFDDNDKYLELDRKIIQCAMDGLTEEDFELLIRINEIQKVMVLSDGSVPDSVMEEYLGIMEKLGVTMSYSPKE